MQKKNNQMFIDAGYKEAWALEKGLDQFATIKAHYEPDAYFIPELKKMSMLHPIIAMEDESAIFISRDKILKLGKMYKVDKGEICEDA